MNDSLKIIANGYVLTGDAGRRAGLIALLVRNGRIIEFASNGERLLTRYPQAEFVDASGHAVLPGFVDPHTHVVWAGDRAAEFAMKMSGAKYLDILAAGAEKARATARQTLDEVKAAVGLGRM